MLDSKKHQFYRLPLIYQYPTHFSISIKTSVHFLFRIHPCSCTQICTMTCTQIGTMTCTITCTQIGTMTGAQTCTQWSVYIKTCVYFYFVYTLVPQTDLQTDLHTDMQTDMYTVISLY